MTRKAELTGATRLTDAYQFLDPLRPLQQEWMDAFYVERPPGSNLANLADELLLDSSEDDKTLLTGTRGSGKTTELERLALSLQSSHTVVRVNVETLLNLGDVNYAELLVVIGLAVYSALQKHGKRIDPKKMDSLRYWFATHILEEEEREWLSSIETEINVLFAKFGISLSTSAPKRQKVRAEAQANLSDLIGRLNDLLEAARKATKKRIFVFVDGLDKVYDENQVRDVFLQGANALMEPNCRMIYVVPFALSYSDDFQQVRYSFNRFYALPNIKALQRSGEPDVTGRRMLEQVLLRRMNESLITPEALERLVVYSGGVLRGLISLARDSLIRARRRAGEYGPIDVEDVEQAALQVQNTYRAMLTEEQYRELARIMAGEIFINSPVARQLIHNLSLLEYDGGQTAWWDVHPLVKPLVKEWQSRYG